MHEKDTVDLLKECQTGVKMGMLSLHDLMPKVKGRELCALLQESRAGHEKMEKKAGEYMQRLTGENASPSSFARDMVRATDRMRMTMMPSDKAAAKIVTKGCYMGISGLSKRINACPYAEEDVKNLAKSIIDLEEQTARDMRKFL